jgi:transcriptional/translational regulatory protein YebC/TACO1
MIPSNTVVLNGDSAAKILKLQEKLEDHDDIQAVHANFEIPDDVLASIQEA